MKTKTDPNAVKITGQAQRIRQLEDHIFADTGVRIVITLPTDWEIFIPAEDYLSSVLTYDATVAVWKDHIQNMFLSRKGRPVNTIGQRGMSPAAEFDLPRHAIVFIQPDGKVAHARTLIRNIMFYQPDENENAVQENLIKAFASAGSSLTNKPVSSRTKISVRMDNQPYITRKDIQS